MKPDLLSRAISEAALSKLSTIANHVERFAKGSLFARPLLVRTEFAKKSYDSPMEGVKLLDQLEDEIVEALRSIKCDLRSEDLRRNPDGPKLHEPVIVTDDDGDEPTHDLGNPVGSDICGKPVPQSELTGA